MFEPSCEPTNNCNNDQLSFKAYVARWFAKSSIVAPFIAPLVQELLTTSAKAAAVACSGGEDGVTCGEKWYVGGYDGSYGIGQQLSALEVTQALLIARAPEVAHTPSVHIKDAPATTLPLHPTATQMIHPVQGSSNAAAAGTSSQAPSKSGDASRNADPNAGLRSSGGVTDAGLKAMIASVFGLVLGS